MKKKNCILLLTLFLAICSLCLPLGAEAAEISVWIDGQKLNTGTSPWVNENGRVYVPLRAISEGLGYSCSWNNASSSAWLQKGSDNAKITLGSSFYVINGKWKKHDAYPVAYQGRILVPVRALSEAVDAEVQYDAAKQRVDIKRRSSGGQAGDGSLKGKVIVLDAGHGKVQSGGWTDPGAVGYFGTPERDIVMDIVYKTAALLQGKGAKVILTRAADYTHLTLAGRAAYATDYNADIFISVHCNANVNREYHGTAMYTNSVSYNNYTDTKLAQALQKHTVAALGTRDAGLFQGSFGVLRNLPCAGVIAEIGFISNPEEEKKLAQNSFRQKAAQGLVNGIEAYFAGK